MWHEVFAINPLAPRDVSGRTNFSADFFLSTDFKEIKMPNLSIQPYKIGLEQWPQLWQEFAQHPTVDGKDYDI